MARLITAGRVKRANALLSDGNASRLRLPVMTGAFAPAQETGGGFVILICSRHSTFCLGWCWWKASSKSRTVRLSWGDETSARFIVGFHSSHLIWKSVGQLTKHCAVRYIEPASPPHREQSLILLISEFQAKSFRTVSFSFYAENSQVNGRGKKWWPASGNEPGSSCIDHSATTDPPSLGQGSRQKVMARPRE